ncbi:MAG: LysR family transcriptional regulator [Angelakisella sp.]|nr:LysR family transcriptional regulator [Angelakisella sp.]
MKLKTLEYFVVLADSRSINEAAQRLYVAQPSLTKALQQMEQELGGQLFFRNKAGITLTEMGQRILPQARQMVEWYNGWLSLPKEQLPRAIDIYVHTSLSGFLIPEILLRFRERYPSLTLNYIMTMKAEEHISYDPQQPALALTLCNQEGSLRRFSKLWKQDPLPLFHGSYGCLVNREGSLAGLSDISLEELLAHRLLLPDVRDLWEIPREKSLCNVLYDLIEKPSGVKSLVVTEVNNAVTLLRKEKEAYVVTFSPACKRYDGLESGQLRYIPFRDYYAGADLCLFYCTQAYRRYPVVRELVQSIRDEAMDFLARHGDEALAIDVGLS